jgi:hypothetical protein
VVLDHALSHVRDDWPIWSWYPASRRSRSLGGSGYWLNHIEPDFKFVVIVIIFVVTFKIGNAKVPRILQCL